MTFSNKAYLCKVNQVLKFLLPSISLQICLEKTYIQTTAFMKSIILSSNWQPDKGKRQIFG